MVKLYAVYTGLCRRQRGFLLMEAAMQIVLGTIVTCILLTAINNFCSSSSKLAAEIQLQDASRHILLQLEKNIGYIAMNIRLQNESKIICTTLNANKQLTIYPEKHGLYQNTRTGRGSGINPLSIEGINVEDWNIKQVSERELLIKFKLSKNGVTREFSHIQYCYNARITSDG